MLVAGTVTCLEVSTASLARHVGRSNVMRQNRREAVPKLNMRDFASNVERLAIMPLVVT